MTVPKDLKLLHYSKATSMDNGLTIISGGIDGGFKNVSNSIYLMWRNILVRKLPDMSIKRCMHAICILNNKIYVLGGTNLDAYMN